MCNSTHSYFNSKSLQVPHAKLQDAFQLTAQLYLNPSVRRRPRALLQAQSFFKRRQHEHQFKKITSFHLGDAKERITKETEKNKINKGGIERRGIRHGAIWCSTLQYRDVLTGLAACSNHAPTLPSPEIGKPTVLNLVTSPAGAAEQ